MWHWGVEQCYFSIILRFIKMHFQFFYFNVLEILLGEGGIMKCLFLYLFIYFLVWSILVQLVELYKWEMFILIYFKWNHFCSRTGQKGVCLRTRMLWFTVSFTPVNCQLPVVWLYFFLRAENIYSPWLLCSSEHSGIQQDAVQYHWGWCKHREYGVHLVFSSPEPTPEPAHTCTPQHFILHWSQSGSH